MRIEPTPSIEGAISLPGDKSISHRYAILGAMAHGTTSIEGFSQSHDCASTLNCLRKLGIEIQQSEKGIEIQGLGWGNFHQPRTILDAGTVSYTHLTLPTKA